MHGLWGRRAWATAALAAAMACAPELFAQDRPIDVIDTEPAPARIDGGTFFLVGGQVRIMVRNRHTSPVLVTLRLWVFDQAGRLKGVNSYCVPEWFERSMRRAINVSLEVRDLVSTDSVTVGVERVASDRMQWSMTDSAEVAVGLARQRGLGTGGQLRLDERHTQGRPSIPCPCECPSIAASCEAQCFDTGLHAFTCTPIVLDGCSASCSCK
jgi:hypothetical protein